MKKRKCFFNRKVKRRIAFLLVLMFVFTLAGCGKEQKTTGRRAGSIFDLFADDEEDPFDEAITGTEAHTGDYEVDPPMTVATTEEATEAVTEEPTYADVENEEFNEILYEMFKKSLEGSRFNYVNYIKDPNDYGITKPKDEIYGVAEISTDNYEEAKKGNDELIELFEGIDVNTLTEQQRFDYDYLLDYLYLKRVEIDSYMLINPFAPATGIQEFMPIFFMDYYLESEEDIKDYFDFIEAYPDFIHKALEEQTEKVDAGCGPEDCVLDLMIEQCDNILNIQPEDNAMIACFDEAMEKADFLSDAEKKEYSKKCREYIEKYFIPAYEDMKTTFESWKGKGVVKGGLCYYGDEGKAYYKYLIRSLSGSDKTPEEMIEYLNNGLTDCNNRLRVLYSRNPDAYQYYYENSDTLYDYLNDRDPKDVLDEIIEKTKADYPDIGDLNYTVTFLNDAMAKARTNTAAYYTIPRFNDTGENLIRVNRSMTNKNAYWGTLAHEGSPGHMYMFNYFKKTDPQPIRMYTAVSELGYVEGWAVYACYDALKYCDFNNSEYASVIGEMEILNELYGFLSQARIDMGIHYEGWSRDDVYDYMKQNGLNADAAADRIYAIEVSSPGAYLSYSVSYLEMRDLRDYAEKELGDKFNVVEYHKAILDVGPCKFDQLRKVVDKYIREHR